MVEGAALGIKGIQAAGSSDPEQPGLVLKNGPDFIIAQAVGILSIEAIMAKDAGQGIKAVHATAIGADP